MLAPIQVHQNKFIRSYLFLPKSTNINYLFHKFNALKINNIIKFTYAKFMLKYSASSINRPGSTGRYIQLFSLKSTRFTVEKN